MMTPTYQLRSLRVLNSQNNGLGLDASLRLWSEHARQQGLHSIDVDEHAVASHLPQFTTLHLPSLQQTQ